MRDAALISEMVGLTFHHVKGEVEDGEVLFIGAGDTPTFRFYHEQDCCEHVTVAEIIGDLEDLVGVPILEAREDIQNGMSEDEYESSTWTFYNFRTIKGSVTIRWVGTSNGYYSERVSLERMPTEFESVIDGVYNDD